MCVQSNDIISDSIFPNVTIFNENDAMPEGASIVFFNNTLWVKVVSRRLDTLYNDYTVTFYTVEIEKMKATKITELHFGEPHSDRRFFDSLFRLSSGTLCDQWTSSIYIFVTVVVLGTASVWLTMKKNLSVGIVPAVVAVYLTVTHTDFILGMVLCDLAANAAFLGLVGCVRLSISRETLIWALYTTGKLLWTEGWSVSGPFHLNYDTHENFEGAMFVVVMLSLIGFILDHPVMFLFGWIGGIWAIIYGVLLLFVSNGDHGLSVIGYGAIGGSGCATLGFHLIKYRAYLIYSFKRGWIIMKNAIERNRHFYNIHQQQSNRSATRYTPILRTLNVPPIRTSAPVRTDNDITAGLLDEDI
jgi:hypothetical protein